MTQTDGGGITAIGILDRAVFADMLDTAAMRAGMRRPGHPCRQRWV